MSDTGLIAAVSAALKEADGTDAASWAALADLAADAIDGRTAAACRWLSRVAQAAPGSRLAHSLSTFLRLAAASPVGFARFAYSFLAAHGCTLNTQAAVLPSPQTWRAAYGRVRYVGHYNVNEGQRRELGRWRQMAEGAGGIGCDVMAAAIQCRIAALATAEALEREAAK